MGAVPRIRRHPYAILLSITCAATALLLVGIGVAASGSRPLGRGSTAPLGMLVFGGLLMVEGVWLWMGHSGMIQRRVESETAHASVSLDCPADSAVRIVRNALARLPTTHPAVDGTGGVLWTQIPRSRSQRLGAVVLVHINGNGPASSTVEISCRYAYAGLGRSADNQSLVEQVVALLRAAHG